MTKVPQSQSSVKASFGRLLSIADRQYWIYAAVILVSMLAFGQLTNPFIAHDDYDWLNSQSFGQGFESPWSKSFSEGRWIEYLWSLVSTNLSIGEAFAIYLVLYVILCFIVARIIQGRAGVFIALALFFSPMGANATLWPVTQIPAMAVYILAFSSLSLARTDTQRLMVFPLAITAGFLSYPAFSPVLLLCYGLVSSNTIKSITIGLGVYIVSSGVAVLIAFTLNLIYHGHFTIEPAPWRHATPLFTTGTLPGNITRYTKYYDDLRQLWPALFAGTLSFLICFYTNTHRRKCLVILLYGLVILLMEATLCILSGVDLPMRTSTWIWVLWIVPGAILLGEYRVPLVAGSCLLVIFGTGLMSWHKGYENIQYVYPAMHYIGDQTSEAETLDTGKFDKIITYGDARARPSLGSLHSNRMLRNYLYKEFKIDSTPCIPSFCQVIQTRIDAEDTTPPLLLIDHKLIIVLSKKDGGSY